MSDDLKLNRWVFVIYDLVAESWFGQLIVDRHPAPVCRMFNQLLADKATQLAQHPKDYNLVHVGYIADSGALLPIVPQVVTTGEAWLATQTPLSKED